MARIVDFFDGAQSETTPTIGNIVASGIITYPDDATYEATEQNAPQAGNIYFNTTSNLLRYYNGSTWIDIVDDESLQTIINKTIDADNNTITNLEDDNIKAGAAIDVTKLHDGSVDNTEFGHLDGVTSSIQTQLDNKQETSEKGQPNGYASLDGSGFVPAAQLPSYVDDVEEYADFASLPVTGETGKIYVTIDDNKTYRWTGSVYVEVGPASQANNQAVIEGGNWSAGDVTGVSSVQEQLVETTNLQNPTTGLTIAQTFTATANHSVDAIELALRGSGVLPQGSVGLEIWNVDGGSEPDETSVVAVATSEDVTDIPDGVTDFRQFNFPSTVNLVNGTEYAIVFNTDAITSGFIRFRGSNSDVVTGQAFDQTSPPTGAWTPRPSFDYYYRILESAAAPGIRVSLDADAFVQQEGFANDRNTISAQNIDFVGTNDIAYVTVNKSSDVATVLPVTVAELASFAPGEDDLIIIRKILNGAEIGRKLFLEKGETAELEDALAPVAQSNLENITIVGNGTATWTVGTPHQLVLDEDIFISIPPLADSYHTIQAQTINITNDQCAYVTLDRAATGTTNLTVSVDDIANIVPDLNTLIFLRAVNDEAYFGLKDPQRIIDGEAQGVQRGGGFIQAIQPNEIETKTLSSDALGNQVMSDLTFSGLEIGKTYEIRGTFFLLNDVGAADDAVSIFAMHDGSSLSRAAMLIRETSDTVADALHIAMSATFVATASTLTFEVSGSSGSSGAQSGASKTGTFVELEKRNDLETNVVTNAALTQTINKSFGGPQLPTGTLGAAWNKVTFGTLEKNDMLAYNPATGQYTAIATGDIFVAANLELSYSAAAGVVSGVRFENTTSGKLVVGRQSNPGSTTACNPQCSGLMSVVAGDVIEVQSFITGSSPTFTNTFEGAQFSIHTLADFTNYGVVNPDSQVVEAKNSAVVSYPFAAPNYGDFTSITLAPGEWEITGSNMVDRTSAGGSDDWVLVGISVESGNSFTDREDGYNTAFNSIVPASGIPSSVSVAKIVVNPVITTTYYLKGRVSSATNLNSRGYSITARKFK